MPKSLIFIASDHAGVELGKELVGYLKDKQDVRDLGPSTVASVDYPDFAVKVSREVLKNSDSLGILICGSGIGMSIAANKVHGIRAAVVSEPKSAALAREHNNAQILCLGARVITPEQAKKCVDAFLNAKFDTSSPRHQNRIEKMAAIEKKECT